MRLLWTIIASTFSGHIDDPDMGDHYKKSFHIEHRCKQLDSLGGLYYEKTGPSNGRVLIVATLWIDTWHPPSLVLGWEY